MRSPYASLMCKFIFLYFCIMLFGVSILTLSNLYILGMGIKALLQYNISAVLLEGVAGTLLMQGITILSLKNTRKLLKSSAKSEECHYKAWKEMVSFPSRVFWGMAVFGVAASIVYHTGEMLYFGDPFTKAYCIKLATIVLFEQALSLVLALLFFTGARRLLRPYVLKIPGTLIKDFPKTTFYNNLLVIFCCLMIITIYSVLWYVLDSTLHRRLLNIRFLVYLSLSVACFGIVVFRFYIKELRGDFNVLIEAMTSLLEGSRAQLKAKVPIVTNNEVGDMGLIFNKLQEKVSKEYDEIESELQLASSIQQKLLPKGELAFGPFTAAGVCKPCHEVGGDFFDIITPDNNKFTVIIGDVIGKGMPAALIMSAVLLLFRNEIHHGGTASEILNRLNKMVVGFGLNDVCLTLGIAVFDTCANTMQYASSGHVAPYILEGRKARQLVCSSLPLGICPEEEYEHVEYHMEPGARLVFYTDGIIDVFDNKGISGFDTFESILCSTDEKLSVSRQIDFIMKNIECSCKPEHEDDKTLLVVQYNEK